MFLTVLKNGLSAFGLLVIGVVLGWCIYKFIADIVSCFRGEDKEITIFFLKMIGWVLVVILVLGIIITMIVGEQK